MRAAICCCYCYTGTCVWATGIAMHPLVRGLKESLQARLSEVQNSRTGVVSARRAVLALTQRFGWRL